MRALRLAPGDDRPKQLGRACCGTNSHGRFMGEETLVSWAGVTILTVSRGYQSQKQGGLSSTY